MMPIVTAEERFGRNTELIADAQNGDTDAEEELVNLNYGLVRGIARRFCGRGLDYEDLVQTGMMGLIHAARSFDAERGFAFSTYAVPLIIGEIKRCLRDDGLIKVGRQQKKLGMDLLAARNRLINENEKDPSITELAASCGVSVEEAAMALDAVSPVGSLSAPTGDDENMTLESRLPDPENETVRVIDRVALGQSISKLPEIQRKIILLRYFRNMTQQRTAEILGLSQVKVSREEKKTLEFLRSELI